MFKDPKEVDVLSLAELLREWWLVVMVSFVVPMFRSVKEQVWQGIYLERICLVLS